MVNIVELTNESRSVKFGYDLLALSAAFRSVTSDGLGFINPVEKGILLNNHSFLMKVNIVFDDKPLMSKKYPKELHEDIVNYFLFTSHVPIPGKKPSDLNVDDMKSIIEGYYSLTHLHKELNGIGWNDLWFAKLYDQAIKNIRYTQARGSFTKYFYSKLQAKKENISIDYDEWIWASITFIVVPEPDKASCVFIIKRIIIEADGETTECNAGHVGSVIEAYTSSIVINALEWLYMAILYSTRLANNPKNSKTKHGVFNFAPHFNLQLGQSGTLASPFYSVFAELFKFGEQPFGFNNLKNITVFGDKGMVHLGSSDTVDVLYSHSLITVVSNVQRTKGFSSYRCYLLDCSTSRFTLSLVSRLKEAFRERSGQIKTSAY